MDGVRNILTRPRPLGLWLGALLSTALSCSAPATTSPPPRIDPAHEERILWKRPPSDACPQGSWTIGTDGCGVCDMHRPQHCQIRCDEGHGGSCAVLALTFEFGTHGTKSYERSIALYERGCSLGSDEGCEGFARQVLRGEGRPSDVRGLDLLEKLCAKGRGSACTLAAKAYLEGLRPAPDTTVVFRLLDDACARASAEGCRMLAEHLAKIDVVRAERARERACALDGALCKQVLGDHDRR